MDAPGAGAPSQLQRANGHMKLIHLLPILLLGQLSLARAAEPWTLDRAIGHALTNSPDARLARHRIAGAQAVLMQANAAFWPQAQVQSSYTRTDHPVSVFGYALNQRSFQPGLDFNNVPDSDNLNVRGVITVPLYAGGRNKAGREAALAGRQAAREEAEAIHNTLAFEVARAFHTILKTRAFIDATDAAVRSFESNRGIASNRFVSGTILKTELLDVEVRLAQAREDLVRARNAHALSQRALRNLLGLEQGEFAVVATAPDVQAPAGNDFSGRPELAAIRQQQRAADAGVRRAKAGHWPRVSAFGSVDYDRGWRLDGDGASYMGGVLAQWDLWDGRLTRGRINEARAILDASYEEERRLLLAIGLEAEQARLNLEEATERLAVLEMSIAQAAESVELTRSRFEQGLAIATQLIDAETALTSARVRLAEAEADQRIAIAALKKALGLPQTESVSNRR
jgi:outer membrane protein